MSIELVDRKLWSHGSFHVQKWKPRDFLLPLMYIETAGADGKGRERLI
jgi:hypothetical protein